tara:strand:+ start:402 stop:839 length:438 start_codon:yes stop_codon:yes gene_type:complete
MTSSLEKKRDIEKKIKAIEKRFDQKLQATKETIEIGKSPQKLVSKRPFSSLFITFGLGLLAGKVAGTASTQKKITADMHQGSLQNHSNYSSHLVEEKGWVGSDLKQRVKRRITQKIIDGILNFAEDSLNDYLRTSNSVKGTESKK